MSQNVSQTRSERGRFFDTLKKLNNDVQDEINRQECAVQKLEQEILDLRRDMSALKEEKTTLQQRLNNQDLEIGIKTKEIVNLKAAARLMKQQFDAREREFNNTIKNLSVGKTKAEQRIEEMQTALKDLTLGLSKLSGATVTYTSPDFANGSDEDRPDALSKTVNINSYSIPYLTDENRPTKLAEDFSEIFYNEWTYAYEGVAIETKKEKTQFLLNILKRASNLCFNAFRDHMNEIRKSFSTLTIRNYAEEGSNFENSDLISTNRTVAVQTPVYTTLMEDFELLSDEQEKTIVEIKKVFEHRHSESFQTIATEMIAKEFKLENRETVNYVIKCVKICWSMFRHEPPIHMEFPRTEGDIQFDTNMFKYHTRKGKHLDFVVWPALYLHENGPILAQGIAEGRK